ncbi:MAG: hypothetical protein Q7R49_02115 [Candidatus Daviesbacteria bacterium]|nr:hypothetical protein [Candidatus Daviesbacteria bacterium]
MSDNVNIRILGEVGFGTDRRDKYPKSNREMKILAYLKTGSPY